MAQQQLDCDACSPCTPPLCCKWPFSLPETFEITVNVTGSGITTANGGGIPTNPTPPVACSQTITVPVSLTMQLAQPGLWVNSGGNYYGGSIQGAIQPMENGPPFFDQQGYAGFPNPHAGCSATPGDFLYSITYGSEMGIAVALQITEGGGCFNLYIYILDLQTTGVTMYADITTDTTKFKNIVPPFVNITVAGGGTLSFLCGASCFLVWNAFFNGNVTGSANPTDYSPLTAGFAGWPNNWQLSALPGSLYGQFPPQDNNSTIQPYATAGDAPCHCATFARVYTLTLSGSNVPEIDGSYAIYWQGGNARGTYGGSWVGVYELAGGLIVVQLQMQSPTQSPSAGFLVTVSYGYIPGQLPQSQGSGSAIVYTCPNPQEQLSFTCSGQISGSFPPPNPITANFTVS